MEKEKLFKILGAIIAFLVFVLFMLKNLVPTVFNWFNFGYAVAMFGIALMLITYKNIKDRKQHIITGGFAVISAVALISGIFYNILFMLPGILIIVMAILLVYERNNNIF